MFPSVFVPHLNRVNGDPGEAVAVIPIISSPSSSSTSSDRDLGGNPLQPPTSSVSIWATFADPPFIDELPFTINPSSQSLLLALLCENLALLPQLRDFVLASIPLLFSSLLNFLDHAGFPAQPIVNLMGLIVFFNKEKLRIQMVNDNSSEHRDTLPEPSDAWECFFRLSSQIQSVENEIHIR